MFASLNITSFSEQQQQRTSSRNTTRELNAIERLSPRLCLSRQSQHSELSAEAVENAHRFLQVISFDRRQHRVVCDINNAISILQQSSILILCSMIVMIVRNVARESSSAAIYPYINIMSPCYRNYAVDGNDMGVTRARSRN